MYKRQIIRDLKAKRYWINENLLRVRLGHHTYNIAESLIEILDKYIEVKQQMCIRDRLSSGV